MRRIGTLNGKPIVQGNENEIKKILYYIKKIMVR